MNWLEKIRRQKVLSVTLVLATLVVGIMIGTVINTGVQADKKVAATDATPLSIPSPQQMGNDFTALAKRLEPAVVHVSTAYDSKPASASRGRAPEGEEEGDESMELFRRFFGGPGAGPMPRPFRRQGAGSGFIVDPKGYIITNHHVVDNADKITVRLHGDLTEHPAKLIGIDPETDVAVVKIDAGRSLPFASVGNSDAVQVGDWAVAIGSPFGLEATVTAGIISAKGREGPGQFQSFIQTDAAINPGNSGGPLLNIKGEVIGVNTMIATRSGGYQGIGFALPVNTAVKVYNQIIKEGKVSRGSIGISWDKAQEKPETLKALGVTGGVIVQTVEKNGPAEKAGLRPEDIIIAMNGKPVKNGDDLVGRVADTPIGDKVQVTVDRGGKKLDFDIVVRDRMEVFPERFARFRKQEPGTPEETSEVRFGIKARSLSEAEREESKLDSSSGGVLVLEVLDDSFASEVGLQERDIITSINRQPVSSVDDIRKVQGRLKGGDPVAFRVLRPIASGVRGQVVYNPIFVSGKLPVE